MLYARAAADVCRRVAPDALAGLAYTVEELEISEPDPTTTVTTKRTAKRAQLAAAPEAESPQSDAAVAEPDPTPDPDVDPRDVPATPEQVTKLNIQLQEAGITDRDAKLAYLSEQIHRDIASSKDLTKAEAHSLIDALEREPSEPTFGDDSAHDDQEPML